ncbi:MAG TPA: hypothetical protein PLS63_11335 [Microthrixaceae bacterium]|nr:hypothetical protein [Microthrixaceae bacterium]
MAQEPIEAATLTVEDIDDVRLLLRQSDEGSRVAGLAAIDEWGDRHPDAAAATSLLKAATLAYPWVRSQRIDPAIRLARLLCRAPRLVTVADVEAAYLVSAERVRRVLLHLLALRRDAEGVVSLAFLVGPDGPGDLLPLPTGGLLRPALSAPNAIELVPSLVHAAARPGWSWHSAQLLEQMVLDGMLGDERQRRVVQGLDPVVAMMVAACDQALADPRSVPVEPQPRVGHPSQRQSRDPSRADRFRLLSVVSLLRVLPSDAAAPSLRRVLASADPRVSAVGATALVAAGESVAPERFDLVARDPESRSVLLEGLDALGRAHDVARRWRSGAARAEGDLVRWLAADTELGAAPDEIEHLDRLTLGEHPDDGAVHLFRFRVRAPHWSSARGWMVGAAGPYTDEGAVVDGSDQIVSSVYAAEDDDELDGHLDAILDGLGAWPDNDEV